MPIYEYCCSGCGHYEEFLEKVSAPALKRCPSCGKRKFKRLVSLSAFHLKGEGWYVTDFRGGDKKKPQAENGKDTAEKAPDTEAKPDKAKAGADKEAASPKPKAGKSKKTSGTSEAAA